MSYRDYKPVDIEFNGDKVEDREAVVTLDNGTEIHICACYESWEQYGGCKDEIKEKATLIWLYNRNN